MARRIGKRYKKTLDKIRRQLIADWEDGELSQTQFDEMMDALEHEEFD